MEDKQWDQLTFDQKKQALMESRNKAAREEQEEESDKKDSEQKVPAPEEASAED